MAAGGQLSRIGATHETHFNGRVGVAIAEKMGNLAQARKDGKKEKLIKIAYTNNNYCHYCRG